MIGEEHMQVDKRWSLSKSVSIPNIIGFAMVMATMVWQASALNSRLEAVERRQDRQEQQDAKTDAANRISLLEERMRAQDEKVSDLRADIKDILSRTDKILERLSGK